MVQQQCWEGSGLKLFWPYISDFGAESAADLIQCHICPLYSDDVHLVARN